ncbi:hypothetical protein M0802_009996 [Mischocyttarus mexicanus]|nr:hypothetical protein M0802_009996 [Mischocyttarus mexicanus]
MNGYKIGNKDFNILCYVDDAVLIANSEDNLKKLLHKFNITSKKYNMIILAEKTKCLTISKEPIRCKLKTNGRIIKQTMILNYLGVNGYKIGNKDFNILCYVDDAVLIANSEDNLKKLLHKFNITSKKYNMIILAEKTKCLTISKEPIRCKLETNGRIIEQDDIELLGSRDNNPVNTTSLINMTSFFKKCHINQRRHINVILTFCVNWEVTETFLEKQQVK